MAANLSTTERINIGRERLLTCLAECGAENDAVVLLELQKAYFNKYDEYLNKAELRKYFAKGHMKQVFENFMAKDVRMETEVNATGSLYLRMLRPLHVALADMPKAAKRLLPVTSNGETVTGKEVRKHATGSNMVPLPTNQVPSKFRLSPIIIDDDGQPTHQPPNVAPKLPSNRKEIVSLGLPPKKPTTAATKAKREEKVSEGILVDFGVSMEKPKENGGGNNNTLPAFELIAMSEDRKAQGSSSVSSKAKKEVPAKKEKKDESGWSETDNFWGEEEEDNEESSEMGDEELEQGYQQMLMSQKKSAESKKKRTAVIKTSAKRAAGTVGDKPKSMKTRQQRSDSIALSQGQRSGGDDHQSKLEAKWEEEKREREALFGEHLRKKREMQERKKREQQESQRGTQYEAVKRDVEKAHAAELDRAFNNLPKMDAKTGQAKKPLGNVSTKSTPSFAQNVLSSEDEEEDEEETEEEEEYGSGNTTEDQLQDEEEGEGEDGQEEDGEEEPEGTLVDYSGSDETEQIRDNTTDNVDAGIPKKEKKLDALECCTFVGLISTIMKMRQNINHRELHKFMVANDCSGAFARAFHSANALVDFISTYCPNITVLKVSAENVALLWSEKSDGLFTLMLQKVGKVIITNEGLGDGVQPA